MQSRQQYLLKLAAGSFYPHQAAAFPAMRRLAASSLPAAQSRKFFTLQRKVAPFNKMDVETPLLSNSFSKRSFARKNGGGSRNGSGPSDNDYYGMLGLDRDASQSDVKKAYF